MKLILSTLILILSLQNQMARASETGEYIVGGQNVTAADPIARRTVGLFMVTKDNKGGLCTGSILNKGAILTAAHCVHDVKAVAIVFSLKNVANIALNAFKGHSRIGSNYRIATNFRQLPGYSGEQGGLDEFTDLALITFGGGLPAGYEPAHFLNQSESARVLTVGAPVIVSGYGITSAQERDGLSGNTVDTSGTLRQVAIQFAGFSQNKKDMILKGRPGKDACSGDSGGPALVRVGSDVYVVGVASRSDCVSTSIYTWVPREKAARAVGTMQALAAF